MIDPHSGVPLHRQVADDLRRRIGAGEWAPGAHLPREVDLAHEYGVGLDTVRQAYEALRSGGVIRPGGPGRRASVPPAEPLQRMVLPARAVLTVRMPTPEEMREHGIPPGVPVAEVRHEGRSRLFRGDEVDWRGA
ncbi:GntR family transcriptional regulator [Catellatospora coxensis]|uniref:HTH gntR-type domain-containing protein n=1 Tax=Catellatospora coxensis TaxID=310354 RepID=A0A8J3PAV2_9ACTN|nr:winged helix-turn-helix domain-containing protein [Catellatospora coxensis]GIG10232.1 hypothetical protein Cco03nite_69320 [Catellatospora coxensis]